MEKRPGLSSGSTLGLESAEKADRTGDSRRGSSYWAGFDDLSSAREAELRAIDFL